MSYKIHFIRHGLTAGNLEGRYIGVTDLPLCPEGIGEIRSLMEADTYPQAQKVYTSPLQRCVQTAGIIYPGSLLQVVEQLAEMDFGEYEGMRPQDLKDDPEHRRWMLGQGDDPENYAPHGGEALSDFINRITRGIDQVVRDVMENRIQEAAVITHGALIAQLLAQFGYPKMPVGGWLIQPGQGVTVLIQGNLWARDRVMEAYDLIPAASPQAVMDEEAYLDYAESLMDEE